MSLERTHRIDGWTGSRSQKILALIAALLLALGAFLFTGREARAQQSPQEEAPQQTVAETVVNERTVTIDGEVVEPATGTLPIEESPPDKALPAASPPDPTPQTVVRYGVVETPEPPVSEPVAPVDTDGAPEPVEPGVDAGPAPASESMPSVEPAPPAAELVPEPVVFEENEPLPESGAPAVPVVEEEEYQSPAGLETTVSSADETLQGAADVSRDVADETILPLTVDDEGLIYTTPGGLPSGGEVGLTPERPEGSGFPSGLPEDPSRSAPQPSSPFALLPVGGGGAFSLTSSELGSSGFHLLLLCVLVYGLVLLRRDGELSWGFWEPPKPSSALLRPLERPG